MMRYRLISLLVVMSILLTACNLGTSDSDDTPEPLATPTTDATQRPAVSITSPNDGDEVVTNNTVRVEVSTSGAVESVELFVNGDSVQRVSIGSPTDATSRSLLTFTPVETGTATVRVVAYRGTLESAPDEIELVVNRGQSNPTNLPSVPTIDVNDPTCRAQVNTNLNFRRSPNTESEVIRVLAGGEVLPIVGQLADGSWLQLQSNVTLGWVSRGFVTQLGNCGGIVIVRPPATSTPVRTATPIPSATPLPSNTPNPTEPPPPNLVISSVDGPRNVGIPGGETSVTVEYSAIITNTGGTLNGSFATTGELLPGSGVTFDFGVVGNLGPNQSISLEGDVTFTSDGTFALQVTTDSEDDIDESVEGDNVRVVNVTVTNE